MTGLSFLFIEPNPTDPLNLEAAVFVKILNCKLLGDVKKQTRRI